MNYRGAIDVIFGTHPGNDDEDSGNLDAMHALRLARLANVRLHPYPDAAHTVVDWLAKHNQLDDLLRHPLAADEIIATPDQMLGARGVRE